MKKIIKVPAKYKGKVGTYRFMRDAMKASRAKEFYPYAFVTKAVSDGVIPGDVRFCVKGLALKFLGYKLVNEPELDDDVFMFDTPTGNYNEHLYESGLDINVLNYLELKLFDFNEEEMVVWRGPVAESRTTRKYLFKKIKQIVDTELGSEYE